MSAESEYDFEKQLELEEQEKRKQENANVTDPYTYTDQSDGTIYEWNHEKQAWFPKISDDFIAAYQASYGQEYAAQEEKDTVASAKAVASKLANAGQGEASSSAEKSGEKRKAEEQPPGWFEVADTHNTNVYVSNLPRDITDEEFVELMSKCGFIMKDPNNGKLKMKLYRDHSGQLKGDALCCYMKIESVDLALKILDGYQLRNREIHVERAKFELKGTYDPTKKPKKKKSKEKKKIQELQAKLLDWRPDRMRGERLKHEKTIIIKNLFDPKEFENDVTLILEYQNDLKEECAKFGPVKKVVIYDRHPEGVASVTFQEAEMGDACVAALHGRWFACRLLSVATHDGKTKYAVQETAEEKEARLRQWETFLEKEEAVEEAKTEGKK